MKIHLALILSFVTSANLATADILVKATRMPGYEINPESSVLTIDTSGEVKTLVHNYRANEDRVVQVAILSAQTIERIEAEILALPANDELVDQQAGQPLCTDTDSYVTSVSKDGKEVATYRSESCHEWLLRSNGARFTNGLVHALLGL